MEPKAESLKLRGEMQNPLKVYLDMCVYNRPFDDQTQPRIVIETQIVVVLLLMASQSHLDLINSFALAYENNRNPKIENLIIVSDLLGLSSEYISFDQQIVSRALEHENMGISGMDALHVACAEKAKADSFVTCDDRLINKLKKTPDLKVSCCSLLEFVSQEVFTQ